MFGLEGNKKKDQEFLFELEEELDSAQQGREMKEFVIGRIHEIKGILRSGKKEEEFDRWGSLLLGYTALQKVIARVTSKK